jgi:hypothetical protein
MSLAGLKALPIQNMANGVQWQAKLGACVG